MRMFFSIIGVLTLLGCATAPHPLLQALAPKNLPRTLADATDLQGRAWVSVRSGLIPASFILVEQRGDQVIVRIRPPFNTEEFLRYYREELKKRGTRNTVVIPDSIGGAGP